MSTTQNYYNELFGTSIGTDKVTEVAVDELIPFDNQPFSLYSDERLEELANDIQDRGLDNPLLVRPFNGDYQIIAGHNRFEAMKRLGWQGIPVVIRKMTDEEAELALVQSNFLQRQVIKESEKAKAYALKNNALKRQGKKGNDTLQFISDTEHISKRTLSRYIACSHLTDELLQLLDTKKISLAKGEMLSQLKEPEQEIVAILLFNGFKLSDKQVLNLKNASKESKQSLTEEEIDNLLKHFSENKVEKGILEKAEGITEISEQLEKFNKEDLKKLFKLMKQYKLI